MVRRVRRDRPLTLGQVPRGVHDRRDEFVGGAGYIGVEVGRVGVGAGDVREPAA
jgi:hypothetical protein